MFRGLRWFVLCLLVVVGGVTVFATGLAGSLVDVFGDVVVPKVEAVAYLQVRRASVASGEMVPGESTDRAYEIYKQTQRQLLRSPFVIAAALRMLGISELPMLADKDKPVEWLINAMQVVASPDSEILAVGLKGRDPTQVKKIVDAVVQAYQEQVVELERQERVQLLNHLQRDYLSKKQEIENREAQLAERTRQLGAIGASSESIQRQLAMRSIESLERSMEGLTVSLLELDGELKVTQQLGPAQGPTSDGQSDRALRELQLRKQVITEALDQTRKDHAQQAAELIQAEQSAAAMVVEQDELRNLKELLEETQARISGIKLELQRPPRVKLLRGAECL